MECSERTDFQSCDSVNRIVHRTGGTGKMKNVVHSAAVKRLINVDLTKFKASFVAEMMKISLSTGQEVIRHDYGITLRQQGVAQVRAQEAGSAGDQGAWLAHDLLIFLEEVVASAGAASGMAAWRPTL